MTKTKTANPFWKLGQKYVVRTVRYFIVGTLSYIDNQELVFERARWVASTGKWNEYLKSGKDIDGSDFVGPALINRLSIIDATTIA